MFIKFWWWRRRWTLWWRRVDLSLLKKMLQLINIIWITLMFSMTCFIAICVCMILLLDSLCGLFFLFLFFLSRFVDSLNCTLESIANNSCDLEDLIRPIFINFTSSWIRRFTKSSNLGSTYDTPIESWWVWNPKINTKYSRQSFDKTFKSIVNPLYQYCNLSTMFLVVWSWRYSLGCGQNFQDQDNSSNHYQYDTS